jgi:hypothetical protein
LSVLPDPQSASPVKLAIATSVPLLLFSLMSLLLASGSFANVSTAIVTAVMGLLGIIFLYGWLIQGWGFPSPKSGVPDVTADIKAAEGAHFRRIEQLNQIKALDPIAFERFIGTLFERMGYEVETTTVAGDKGVDLFLRKDNRTAIAQCKRYEGSLGQPVVRDLYGTMLHTRADEAYLVTTGTISLPAQQWAMGKFIHLVDGNTLVEWIETFKETSEESKETDAKEEPTAWIGLTKFPLRAVINDLAGNNVAAGFIALAFALPVCYCGGLFTYAIADPTLREVGLLPTYTPTPTQTTRPTPTTTPTPTNTDTPTSVPTDTPTSVSTWQSRFQMVRP